MNVFFLKSNYGYLGNEIAINTIMPNGRKLILTILPSTNLDVVRTMIEGLTGVSLLNKKLVSGSKELHQYKSLKGSNIKDGAELRIIDVVTKGT